MKVNATKPYTAQVARGVFGFVKDAVMGIGELAYEGIKAVPKLVRSQYTETGQAISQLDAQIFAENVRLGNITSGTIGQDALNIGNAMLKPVTDPWKKGQYVEAGTRAVTEIGTLAFGWIKGARAAKVAKAADALKAEEAAKALKVAAATDAAKAKELAKAEALVDNGVHGGANSRISGVPINGATRNVPLGFQSESQFLTASKELNNVMSAHGVNDATVGVRGSSVTGFGGNPKSPTFGKPFGSSSDIDLFVESAEAVNAFKKQPDFVHPDRMIDAFPGLETWSQRWSDILGRPVSPAAWKPGALPPTPAILVK